jgi:hypothetical protein
MAPVYPEISLEWNGKTYTVTPTYALIQKIEQRLSLASLLNRTLEGQPPLSQLADLLAECLAVAGCRDPDATAENINAELYSEKNAETLTRAASDILFAMLPRKRLPGNPQASEAEADKPKTSLGESTTKSPLDILESSLWNSGE